MIDVGDKDGTSPAASKILQFLDNNSQKAAHIPLTLTMATLEVTLTCVPDTAKKLSENWRTTSECIMELTLQLHLILTN